MARMGRPRVKKKEQRKACSFSLGPKARDVLARLAEKIEIRTGAEVPLSRALEIIILTYDRLDREGRLNGS